MEITKPEPFLVRAGFVLFTLALLTGFAMPEFLNQKMALAAHLTGVMNALLLMALGLAWGLLTVSPLRTIWDRPLFPAAEISRPESVLENVVCPWFSLVFYF